MFFLLFCNIFLVLHSLKMFVVHVNSNLFFVSCLYGVQGLIDRCVCTCMNFHCISCWWTIVYQLILASWQIFLRKVVWKYWPFISWQIFIICNYDSYNLVFWHFLFFAFFHHSPKKPIYITKGPKLINIRCFGQTVCWHAFFVMVVVCILYFLHTFNWIGISFFLMLVFQHFFIHLYIHNIQMNPLLHRLLNAVFDVYCRKWNLNASKFYCGNRYIWVRHKCLLYTVINICLYIFRYMKIKDII